MLPNKITRANAGGRRQLPMRTRWVARVAQFCRSALNHMNRRELVNKAKNLVNQAAVPVVAIVVMWLHTSGRVKLDTIGLVLLLIALVPWLKNLIESIDIPGVGKVQLNRTAETAANLGASRVIGEISREAEMLRQQGKLDAACSLDAAIKAAGAADMRHIATHVAEATEIGTIRRLGGKRVLWVDDEPQNNEYGIKALEDQGVEVVTRRTTHEALEELKRRDFDAIITDQLRYEEGIRKDAAGYELIRALRETGVQTPLILSTAFPNEVEARSRGFYGVTHTQPGIFELVLKAIQGA